MIPRETKCKWCGKPCYWIRRDDRWQLIEAGWVPCKRRFDGAEAPALFTNEGLRIPCVILPPDREGEAELYLHMPHICPESPALKRNRPDNRWKKVREETA